MYKMFLLLKQMLKLKKASLSFMIRHLCLVILFAICYFLIDTYGEQSSHFTTIYSKDNPKKLSFLDCLYFSLVTQTTVGYGHIVPTTTITKVVNMIQLLTIYGVIVISLL